MVPRQDPMYQGTCAAHEHFEARMDERFDSLGDAMQRMADSIDAFRSDLKALAEKLGDGRVEFTSQDARLRALEKNADDCADDRGKMKKDLRLLMRGYWVALGIILAAQALLKAWH